MQHVFAGTGVNFTGRGWEGGIKGEGDTGINLILFYKIKTYDLNICI